MRTQLIKKLEQLNDQSEKLFNELEQLNSNITELYQHLQARTNYPQEYVLEIVKRINNANLHAVDLDSEYIKVVREYNRINDILSCGDINDGEMMVLYLGGENPL